MPSHGHIPRNRQLATVSTWNDNQTSFFSFVFPAGLESGGRHLQNPEAGGDPPRATRKTNHTSVSASVQCTLLAFSYQWSVPRDIAQVTACKDKECGSGRRAR